ncbi:hypothetical protein CMO88_03325 [Candidatus Woesearchaeota archaeon]|nr:hypothetical protein [Candidatus Woesearchaeota archaeon]|tara:strand:+ start:709 stop:1416 length:708 start_codon:yes stop_codon:yes gene_type:complete
MKSVGIVGGLGSKTTARFYLKISDCFRENRKVSPKITIDNCAFPLELEEEIILKSKNEAKLLPFLKESIARLNKAGVDLIVIPCNTAHLFIDELRKHSKAKILSILEEMVKEVKRKNISTVGILATSKIVESGLYQKILEKEGISYVLPNKKSRKVLSKCILEILENKSNQKTRNKIKKVFQHLLKEGAETVFLACTDLKLVLGKNIVKHIDSFDILFEATIKEMEGGKNGTRTT